MARSSSSVVIILWLMAALLFFCSGEAHDSPAPSPKKLPWSTPPPAAAPTSSPKVKPPVSAPSPSTIMNSPPSEAPAQPKNDAVSNRLALTGYLAVGIVAAAIVV